MYEVEALRGYVLTYYNTGEADRRYKILTKDYGVVVAQATSVRKESSKMRYFLARYNLIDFQYIHAKGGYRITGGQLVSQTTKNLETRFLSVLARVGQLIDRLSQGQDEDTYIYQIFDDVTHQLRNPVSKLGESGVDAVELWATGRVLAEFGYFDIAKIPDINPEIYQKQSIDEVDIGILIDHSKKLERYIKQCVLETML